MPKKSLLAPAQPESGSGEYALGTWRAAALSMAVIAPAAWYGLGELRTSLAGLRSHGLCDQPPLASLLGRGATLPGASIPV